jgi:hypothetical protein
MARLPGVVHVNRIDAPGERELLQDLRELVARERPEGLRRHGRLRWRRCCALLYALDVTLVPKGAASGHDESMDLRDA